MRGLRRATLVVAIIATSRTADAQLALGGQVIDSLRDGKPLPGALVTLVGVGLQSRTDSLGRFSFHGLQAGIYEVLAQSAWLDSLRLPPLRVTVALEQASVRNLVLATPSLRDYQSAICGSALSSGDRVLLGIASLPAETRLERMFVGALWSEIIVTTGGLETRTRAAVDTISGGLFELCGLPGDSEIRYRVGDDSTRSEVLRLPPGTSPIEFVEVTVGGTVPGRTARGRVVTESGQPVRAYVEILGDSLASTRTDASGWFELSSVAPRSADLFIRAIGYDPVYVRIEPASGSVELGEVILRPVPPRLATVRVEGARSRAELEFERRRSVLRGIFVDEAELSRLPARTSNSIVGGRPGASGASGTILLRGPRGNCAPRVFFDEVDLGKMRDRFELEELLRLAKRIEIYRATQAPPQFTDFDGCGAIVIWTY